MPARLRKTRSSAFRANAPFASPNKGSVGRPAKKLKLDRGRSSSKTLLRESHAAKSESEDDGEVADDSDEEEDVVNSDSSTSERPEDQENVDPITSVSGIIGTSRRRLRNGKSVLRNQKGSGGYLTSRGHRRSGIAFPVYSPRKRKRDDPEYTDDDEARDDSDEYTDDENTNDSREPTNGSLQEVEALEDIEEDVDNDSSEPDYIDENDQHLLREASAWTLGRLKKAELKRLWLVAGLWDGEDLSGNDEMDTADAMTKDVLVDGIIRARPPSSASTASSSTRRIAKLPPTSRDTDIFRDAERSVPVCNSPDSDDEENISSSQEASHRQKLKANGNATTKPINGLKSASRTRNSSRSGMSQDKRAHFDVTQQSPAHTYRKRRESYASSVASSSTSANGSPKRNGPPSTPRPFAKRGKMARRSVNFDDKEHEDDAYETRSNITADEYDDSQKRSKASGRGLGRRNSKSSSERVIHKHLNGDGKSQSSLNRHTPARRAARKAARAMHDQLDTDEDDVMEVTDIEYAEEGSDDPTPKPRDGKIITRARFNKTHKADQSPLRGKTRRLSTATLTASPDTDSSKRSSVLGPTSSDEDHAESVYSSQQSNQRRIGTKRSRNRRGSGYNLRRNDSSGFDLDTRLGGIDLTDDDDDETAMEAESTVLEEDVEMAEQTSENTEIPGEDSHDEEHGEDVVTDEFLATATQATLKKFKKDVLVRMCEARELDTEGTKEQLSQWLIEWRDSASRSTSSAATARPDSPASAPVDKSTERSISVPKLLRDHSEVADPHTPAHSHGDTKDDVEADGALDLEELGLIDKEIPVEQVQKGDKIGSGGFKDVFIGKLRGRAKVAVCEFRDELSEMDIRELKLLAEFKHPNIVRLLGIAIPERSLHVPCMVVTELCEKGDLFDYIRNVDRPPTHRVLKMMLDIAQGLTYLHDRNPRVIHRDCKSSNILITSRGVCKVGDFGLARVKNTTRSVIRSLVGTVNWQAPELWSPKPRYDYKVDVFSCAMVFWEMLDGWTSEKKQYPWEGENEHWIYLNVGQNKVRPDTKSLITHWGSDLVHLMERMWHHDPSERPLMSDVVDDLTAIMEVHRRS